MSDTDRLATPSPSARAETRAICERVLEAVRGDEAMPLPFSSRCESYLSSTQVCDRQDVEDLVFRLCLEVTQLHFERDLAIRLATKAMGGGRITTRDTDDLAMLVHDAGGTP